MQATTQPAPATVRHTFVVRLMAASYFYSHASLGSTDVSACIFNLPTTDKVLNLCSPAAAQPRENQ
jgi:hypothetical protein